MCEMSLTWRLLSWDTSLDLFPLDLEIRFCKWARFLVFLEELFALLVGEGVSKIRSTRDRFLSHVREARASMLGLLFGLFDDFIS